MKERSTRYIDVSAEHGDENVGKVELSSTKGSGAAAGSAEVVVVVEAEATSERARATRASVVRKLHGSESVRGRCGS